jgi:DNA-binding helix-hairpin-helix protein with protein kinase domain
MELVDAGGQRIVLERELFRGGEGTIHAVAGRPAQLAKLYHSRIDERKQAKLTAMSRMAQEPLLRVAAWPSSTLHAGGRMVGFLMPRFDGERAELHQLYTPATRKQKFRRADWTFLMHAARNVAAAVETVHRAGHVIGDVNQRNFIVGGDATVKVLDCDSFQIRATNRMFLCEVGVPEFTPPELQNRGLAGIERTPNHDAFGLAVLCFQLLFMGRHPFAGRFLGSGEMPIERAIAEGRFAFSRNSRALLMEPPRNVVSFESLPPRLAALFEAAFGGGGARPSAKDWISALESAERELRACALEPMHKFYTALSDCAWCRLESGAGVYYFIGVLTSRGTAFDLGKLWGEVAVLAGLPYEPPARPSFHVVGAPVPMVLPARRRMLIVAKVISVLLLAILGGTFPSWAILFASAIALVAVAPLPGTGERKRRLTRFKEAERAWAEAYRRGESELTVEPLQRRRLELQRLKNAYEGLAAEKQKELAAMTQNARQIQLHRYLEQHLIRASSISDIGPKRKATLSAWGIDTAADVTWPALHAVQGFGPALRLRLLNWRAEIESRFVFDAKRAIPQQDLDALDYRWERKRIEIEQQLRAGAEDVRRHRDAIVERRRRVAKQLEEPAHAWAQAAADLETINQAIGGRIR